MDCAMKRKPEEDGIKKQQDWKNRATKSYKQKSWNRTAGEELKLRSKDVRQSLTHRDAFENDRRGLPRHTDAIPSPNSRPGSITTA